MSKLKEALQRGEFVVTGEIAPPKGTNIGKVIEEAKEYLKQAFPDSYIEMGVGREIELP